MLSDLSSLTQKIEDTLNHLLICKEKNFTLIFEAARYSLLNPGKRLRPLLTLKTAEALGGNLEKALVPACAIEMIHTYSLIHDDLPCMDNDDLRRGKPTLHKLYPEGQAVLAGDLLLTYAFETLSNSPHLSPSQIVEMIQVLAKYSGGEGMIGGQSLDLLSEGKQISWETLKTLHLGKTAALIKASLEIGAIIAEAPSETRTLLSQIGEEIGLSFQMVDDILDVEGNQELLGKPLFSDLKKEKSTCISLLGLAETKKISNQLLESALYKCQALQIEKSDLAALLPKLVHRQF